MTSLLTEKEEEILEAMWTAGENKSYEVSAVKKGCAVDFDDGDIGGLETKEHLIRVGDKIVFTQQGKIVAEGIIRRHRLAEVLVTSILRLKHADMEAIACEVEHCLHPEVEESICTLLGHPEVCPDGKPIPKGRCCERGQKTIDNSVVSLKDLKPSESGKITYIRPGSHSNLHQLIAFGLTPGVIVTVHHTTPAFCVRFENTELALDEDIAANIFVWRVPSRVVHG